jgi:hypothetical protein
MRQTDKELWRERINRAYMESPVGTPAAGLAILAGVVDGLGADLSNLLDATLKAIDENTEELRAIRRRIR